jgi:sialidase-1
MQIIMDMGDDPAFAYDGVGDPAILVDRETGTIWVAATWHHGALGWNGSQPGFDPEQTGQLLLTRSDDDGQTWSAPINLTRQVKEEAWCFLLQGPGRGITMEDGTLVFPAQYQLSPEEGREPRATVIVSRDHGRTWQIGAEAKSNTTEAAVVELREGQLMLNMRDNRGRGGAGARAVATSTNLGGSWQPHPTSGKSLPEPVCMASLLHVGREVRNEADGWLLFSNPAVSAPPRRDMTLQLSTDFGRTWPRTQRVLLDAGQSAGYSCLTMVDDKTVGILYEGSGAHMVFQAVPLDQLLGDR